MDNNFSIRRFIGAAAIIALCCAAPLRAAEHVAIAAIVGDDIITTTDVSERRDLILATSNIPATVENQTKITPRILQSLVDETLEMQEAKRESIMVTDDEVNKALDELTASRHQDPGSLKKFIADNGLSMRSLQNQFRAELSWTKVIQRKLRHNVSISEDEVARAQAAQAAAPGTVELKLEALTLPVHAPADEANANARAEEIVTQLKQGVDMPSIATHYLGHGDVQFNPPTWLAEDSLPPAVQQALRGMKEGEVSPPLRGSSGIQFIQLLERKTTRREADTTEVTLKQIAVPIPPKHTKQDLAQLHATVDTLHANPGSCMDKSLPATPLSPTIAFAHVKLAALNPEQRGIVARLDVGGVSEPLASADSVRLVMLCEKIEPSTGNLPNADEVRQQLYTEKLELEAQKELRNLRRDAFIDVKGE